MSNRPGGGEDYLDKALDKVEQMAGRKVHIQNSTYTIATPLQRADSVSQAGHNVQPGKYRKQNEKITDKLRQMFEKFTGKKVGFAV